MSAAVATARKRARAPAAFEFGDCSVSDGTRGPWTIDTITLTQADVAVANIRAHIARMPWLICPPGVYRRLRHKSRGVVMSNTPMERRTAREGFEAARGDVLVCGLGLGMMIDAFLSKPNVRNITVVEIDADIIALVGDHFTRKDPRVRVVHADAFTWKRPRDAQWDYAWFDVWDDICADNLPDMRRLTRRYAHSVKAHGVWSQREARMQARAGG